MFLLLGLEFPELPSWLEDRGATARGHLEHAFGGSGGYVWLLKILGSSGLCDWVSRCDLG